MVAKDLPSSLTACLASGLMLIEGCLRWTGQVGNRRTCNEAIGGLPRAEAVPWVAGRALARGTCVPTVALFMPPRSFMAKEVYTATVDTTTDILHNPGVQAKAARTAQTANETPCVVLVKRKRLSFVSKVRKSSCSQRIYTRQYSQRTAECRRMKQCLVVSRTTCSTGRREAFNRSRAVCNK